MKKHVLLVLLFFLAADLQAKEKRAEDTCCADEMNFYAKAFGGANFLQSTCIDDNETSYDPGYIFDGALGFCFPYSLRVEAEYAFRRNAIHKIEFFGQGSSHHGHFQTSSYMANLLWNMPLCSWGCDFWRLQPFVGLGIGCDLEQMHASNSRIVFNQEWTQFASQVIAGLAYWIGCNTELTLEYKFHQGGSDFNNHAVGIGLIYKFGFLKSKE